MSVSSSDAQNEIVATVPDNTASHNMTPAAPIDKQNAVVSIGAYLGLIALYCIPVIGWSACIIIAFTAKNKNIRHFSKGMLIFIGICIVIGIILACILHAMAQVFLTYLQQEIATFSSQFTDRLQGQTKDINALSDILKQLQDGISTLPTK